MALVTDLLEFFGEEKSTVAYIQKGLELGLSANKIQEALGIAGLGIRRTKLLDIVRQITGIQSTRSYVKSLGNNYLPDPTRLKAAVLPISKNYSYLVEIRGIDNTTDEESIQHISIVTDSLISKQEAINTAYYYLDSQPDIYSLTPKSASVTSIVTRPRAA
jgi:hypothetical protein